MQNGFMLIWHIIAVWLSCSEANARVLLEEATESRVKSWNLHLLLSLAGLGAPHLQLRPKPLVARQIFPPFACASLSGLKSPRPLPPPLSF